ncbi:MAG: hypothetical protein E3J64_02970 [Anaerolineales bacterium]|nr:MAG: hypothetical protein E3J64_02970 [Anaerolineales bacterium]
MRGCLAVGLALLALVSLACGSLLVASGRGVLGHLPGAEVVIDECYLPGKGGTIRLYEGNVGATTSFWYLATLQRNFFAAERSFFQAYGHPPISSIDCQGGAVDLVGTGGDVEFSFGLDRIESELLDAPLSFYYGEVAAGNPTGVAPRLLGVACGSPLLLVGGVAGLAVFRRRPHGRDGCG